MNNDFRKQLEAWVNKKTSDDAHMRFDDSYKTQDPGRVIIEEKEKEDFLFYSKKIRDYFNSRTKGLYLDLVKGEKELKAIYGAEIQPHHEEFVKWATKTLPNGNWQEWAVKNHAKDPKQFTEEAKSHINHYAGSKHIPHIAKVRFDDHNVEQGIKAFKVAEDQYNAKALQNPQVIKPSKETTSFMDSGDGFSWYDLHKPSCTVEGAAMGHCGNAGGERDAKTLLSLRYKRMIGGVEHHEPAATFVLGPDGKTLGQMKGRGNTIPQPIYHKHIINLLGNSDLIPGGGGYLPSNNFHLDDLSHEEHDALIAKRPELGDYSSRVNVSPEHQAKIIQSGDIEKIRALAEDPSITPEAQAMLMDIDDNYTHTTLASNPNLAPAAQAALMQSSDTNVLHYLATNPNLAPEHQDMLAKSNDGWVLRGLAQNPSLAPEHQAKLAKSTDQGMLGHLAQNPNLAPEHQATLAKSSDEYVLLNLAANRNITPAAQAALMKSSDEYVVYRLARNRNLTPEHQAKLAKSRNPNLLRNLASNLNLAPDIWRKMYSDTEQRDEEFAKELKGLRSLVRLKAESNKNLANRKVRTAEYAKMKQAPIVKKSLSKSQSLNKANYFSNLLLNSELAR